MSFKDDYNINRKLEQSSNKYADIRSMTRKARYLASECTGSVRDSEILTWSARDEKPETADTGRFNHTKHYETSYIEDILSEIDDEDICDAVVESYTQSKKCNYLVYSYKLVQDSPRQARIRILVRMIWSELLNE